LFVAALAALALTLPGQGSAEEVSLRFNIWGSSTSANAQLWRTWVEELNAKGKGEFSIKLFPGGTLGRDPAQQHKLVRDGIADIGWMPISNSPGDYPDAAFMELPFLVENSVEGSVAMWRMHQKGLVRGLSDVRVLAFGIIPPYGIHGTSPVKGIESLKGKKVRVSGAVHSNFIQAVGGTPVGGIHFQSLTEALQRGVVDFSLAEWSGLRGFKIFEVAKHHFDVPLGGVTTALLMRPATYDKLSAKGKAILDAASGEMLSKRWGDAFDSDNVESRKTILAGDKEQIAYPTPPESVKAIREAAETANRAWLQENPDRKARYDTLTGILADIRRAK
jgi:TRAP-type C4-dicarboxylate transport system substrate-binding protein